MKRFGTRSATGKMVKLKLPVDVESLLIEASNRSGRSRSFEAVIRLKDHLHRYPDQFLPLQRDMIGKFGAAKDQWFSSFLLQVENHSSWHRLFVDPLSRAMYSSDGPDFEFVQQKRKEGLSIHEAVWQLAWKKSGPEMASLEAWLEEHEKYRSVA